MADRDILAHILGGYPRPASRAPVPRPGENDEFDAHCAIMMDENASREAKQEMRQALWATWKIEAPQGREASHAVQEDEDAQLARALAESAKEARQGSAGSSSLNREVDDDDELARVLAESARESRQGSRRASPIPLVDDEDAELQRAIAMSQAESRAPKRQRRESTPEEERRMLAEALKASLAEDQNGTEPVSEDEEEIELANKAYQASRQAYREEELKRRQAAVPPLSTAPTTVFSGTDNRATRPSSAKDVPIPPAMIRPPSVASASADPVPRLQASGILGDRARMEQERLARQAARLGVAEGTSSATPAPSVKSTPKPPVVGSLRVATLGDYRTDVTKPSGSAYPGQSTVAALRAQRPHKSAHPLQSPDPFPTDVAGEYYLEGEMRHTAMSIGTPSTDRTFSPEQVIGDKNQISLIIMSSFVIEDEWLETILPSPALVPRVVARPHPREQHPQWNGKVQAQDNGEVRAYPLMVGDWGSAHMKYIWIVYKTGRLRVAIMTANFVTYDWDWIENTVFVQDFLPKRDVNIATRPSLTDDFPIRFRALFIHLKIHKALRYLRENHPAGASMGLSPDNGFEDMSKWDWSKIRVKLVMSIPGTYSGAEKMEELGLSRLGKVLNERGWRPRSGEVVKMEYQGSSLGAYTIDWMDNFYQYSCGKTTQALLGKPKPASFPPVKVIFPSLATVDGSILGRDGGGTMFCGKAYNQVTKQLFHDANSKRGGALMHAKVLIATFEPRLDTLGMTSNPARAANGKRKAEGIEDENGGVGGWAYVGSHNFSSAAWGTVNLKKNPPTLSIRNYELGVVFPLPRTNTQAAANAVAPHIRPARPYTDRDVPWDQKVDSHI